MSQALCQPHAVIQPQTVSQPQAVSQSQAVCQPVTTEDATEALEQSELVEEGDIITLTFSSLLDLFDLNLGQCKDTLSEVEQHEDTLTKEGLHKDMPGKQTMWEWRRLVCAGCLGEARSRSAGDSSCKETQGHVAYSEAAFRAPTPLNVTGLHQLGGTVNT